jgi:carbon storage regulator CsrA
VEIERLADALAEEVRLLSELASLFRTQRRALIQVDAQTVDETVFAVRRIGGTLGEARRRRRILIGAVTGWEEAGLADLDDLLGERMSLPLIEARGTLQATAAELRREIDLNLAILRSHLARDEADPFVHSLSCELGEAIRIGGNIRVVVRAIEDGRVEIGIDAPDGVSIEAEDEADQPIDSNSTKTSPSSHSTA